MVDLEKCRKLIAIARTADEIGTILNMAGYYATKERVLAMVALAYNTLRNMVRCPKGAYNIIKTFLDTYSECFDYIISAVEQEEEKSCKVG